MIASLMIGSAEEACEAVREHPRVVPHGRKTKAPLIPDDSEALKLDLTGLVGVTEYNPGEFTFTTNAGTPVAEIEALLAENGQFMPFDPPLADEGATIGGTVAAGMNGPGRLRYGGMRDFIIGVRFVDGTGRLVRGGGKVVKNSAGFDLPKLMVGSMGRLGVITELTFKVFPEPKVWNTVRIHCRDLLDSLACMADLSRRPLEIQALELEPPTMVVARVGGYESAVTPHARRVGAIAGRHYEIVSGDAEVEHWRTERAFRWMGEGARLIKMPLTLRRVPELEEILGPRGIARRYGVAGNVAWISWPEGAALADLYLDGLTGMVVRGPVGPSARVGPDVRPSAAFADRVKGALDPSDRFSALV